MSMFQRCCRQSSHAKARPLMLSMIPPVVVSERVATDASESASRLAANDARRYQEAVLASC